MEMYVRTFMAIHILCVIVAIYRLMTKSYPRVLYTTLGEEVAALAVIIAFLLWGYNLI